MLKFFKRRSPAHRAVVVPINPVDSVIAAHHGLSPEQWNGLPALVKVDLRESVAFELRAAS